MVNLIKQKKIKKEKKIVKTLIYEPAVINILVSRVRELIYVLLDLFYLSQEN